MSTHSWFSIVTSLLSLILITISFSYYYFSCNSLSSWNNSNGKLCIEWHKSVDNNRKAPRSRDRWHITSLHLCCTILYSFHVIYLYINYGFEYLIHLYLNCRSEHSVNMTTCLRVAYLISLLTVNLRFLTTASFCCSHRD